MVISPVPTVFSRCPRNDFRSEFIDGSRQLPAQTREQFLARHSRPQTQGIALNYGIVTSQFTSLFDFVAQGLGIAIVPLSALPPTLERRLATRILRPALTRRIGILHLADRPLSAAAAGFLEIFRPMLMSAIR
jgi:DNA-binding transcriptional LysR family regulator